MRATPSDYTPATDRLLAWMKDHPEPVTVRAVSVCLSGLNPGQVARAMNKLMEKNLVHVVGKQATSARGGLNLYALHQQKEQYADRIKKMEGDYIPPAWHPVRPGATDALNIPSRGF